MVLVPFLKFSFLATVLVQAHLGSALFRQKKQILGPQMKARY